MTRPARQALRRLTAAMLGLTLAWPVTARARQGPPPSPDASVDATAEPPTEPTASGKPEAEPPPPKAEPPPPEASVAEGDRQEQPPVELTPEELAQRQLDIRVEKAEIHWQEGSRLYQNGRYAEAAVEFERSYAAVPAAAAQYGAALSYERAGKPVEAVRALERYLAFPDCTNTPPEQGTLYCTTERSAAEQALAEQRRRVGMLELDLGEGVDLREVRVAGRTVPLDDFPLMLLPGTVDVEVFGMGPDERRNRPAYITAGETYVLYVAPFDPEVVPPVPAPKGPDGEVDTQRREQRQRQLRATFWVGTGLTATAGIALAVTGGLARYHQQRFNDEKCEELCWTEDEMGNPVFMDRPYPADHEAAVARYRPVTNAMLGVTIGLGVATALVGAFAFRKGPGAPQPGRERARAHVRLGGTGLVVRW